MYSEGNIKIESDNFDDPIRKGYKTRFRTLLVSVLTDLMNEDQYPKELTRIGVSAGSINGTRV